jgi:hypothetical protein
MTPLKKRRSMCPRFRGDTSRTRVPEHFSLLTVKAQVKRVPDTLGDTPGHQPPQRVPGGVSLKRHPRGRRAVRG